MRNATLATLFVIAAAVTGFLAYRGLVVDDSAVIAAASELKRLQLPDLSGRKQNFSQWEHKILIVNFWATWCEPCREEVPALLRVQAANGSKGVQIVGIAVDSAPKVRQFADEFNIAYPLLIGGVEVIDLARKLGNRAGGLPYTVVVDRSGHVVATHLGRISEAQLERAIALVKG
jgi:thiol-disulfide isomerase/thioredoxin